MSYDDDGDHDVYGGMVVVTLVIILGGLTGIGLFALALHGIITATGGIP